MGSEKRYSQPVSVERLREVFDYCAETGVLRWKTRLDVKANWNTRYAGREIKSPDLDGYIQVRLSPHLLKVHRVIWAIIHGEWPDKEIDHINGTTNDNRRNNLRLATSSENKLNRHSKRRGKHPKGVSFHKLSGKYYAYVGFRREKHIFGYFGTPEEARACYLEKAPAVIGEFFHGEDR